MISPGACLLGFLLALGAPESPVQQLHSVQWRGQVFSWQRQGMACWIEDGQGDLRCEILPTAQDASPQDLTRLLQWQGVGGWTLIAVQDGGGTRSPWYEQWQVLPPPLESWLRLLVAVLDSDWENDREVDLSLVTGIREILPQGNRTLPGAFFPASSGPPPTRRFQVPDWRAVVEVDDSGEVPLRKGLRQHLSQRGHGRGGREAILSLEKSPEHDGGLRITSSRHPGQLWLGSPRRAPVRYDPAEAFLPWYPLSRVLEFP